MIENALFGLEQAINQKNLVGLGNVPKLSPVVLRYSCGGVHCVGQCPPYSPHRKIYLNNNNNNNNNNRNNNASNKVTFVFYFLILFYVSENKKGIEGTRWFLFFFLTK